MPWPPRRADLALAGERTPRRRRSPPYRVPAACLTSGARQGESASTCRLRSTGAITAFGKPPPLRGNLTEAVATPMPEAAGDDPEVLHQLRAATGAMRRTQPQVLADHRAFPVGIRSQQELRPSRRPTSRPPMCHRKLGHSAAAYPPVESAAIDVYSSHARKRLPGPICSS